MKRTLLDLKPTQLSGLVCKEERERVGRQGEGRGGEGGREGGREKVGGKNKEGRERENFKWNYSADFCQVFRQLS